MTERGAGATRSALSVEDLAALATAVVAVARRAGREILEVYGSGEAQAISKRDLSPVTQADLRAHRVIVEALENLLSSAPVFSEEASDVPFEQRAHWQRYWLVDPLDGTKEFLSRNGEFTVNIALIERHAPALGVVHAPVTGTHYWGVPGLGAWRAHDGSSGEPITAQRVASSPLRVVGSRSHRGDSLDRFLARVGPHELRAIGSSLKFCLVAEGSADVYPRLGPTSEWDTAAAQAIVEGAGGVVACLDGARLAYNTKADVINPYFLAYADRDRPWLEMLR